MLHDPDPEVDCLCDECAAELDRIFEEARAERARGEAISLEEAFPDEEVLP